jgi:hypothetical protein
LRGATVFFSEHGRGRLRTVDLCDFEFPTFDRDELVALHEAEEDLREGRTTSAEEARKRFGTSDE